MPPPTPTPTRLSIRLTGLSRRSRSEVEITLNVRFVLHRAGRLRSDFKIETPELNPPGVLPNHNLTVLVLPLRSSRRRLTFVLVAGFALFFRRNAFGLLQMVL